jgi:CHAD domain-containing protein
MKLILIPGNATPESPKPGSTSQRLGAWLQLLESCAKKLSRRRVHALRVATLRMLVSAEAILWNLPDGSDAKSSTQRWMKQAGKLRSALGSIREIDVYRSRLEGLRATLQKTDSPKLHTSRDLLDQLDTLDERLKRARKKAERKLTARVEDRLPHLRKLSRSFEAVAPEPLAAPGAESLMLQIRKLQSEDLEFSAENLHAFRKRLRAVRYAVEALGSSDQGTKRMVRQLRNLQVAIGTWHDWDALAREAHDVFSGAAGKTDLAALLDELAGESLTKAIDGCAHTMENLKRLDFGAGCVGALGKRPVQGVKQAALPAMRRA